MAPGWLARGRETAAGPLRAVRAGLGAAASRMLEDVDTVVERDPAARSRAEVALLYPGVHAVWAHRVSHALWQQGATLPARALSQLARFATNIEIHPAAELGRRLFIDHGAGVVVGETSVVGDDVTIYHGVTLGGVSQVKGTKRHPDVGDGVLIGAGAKLLGPIDVGDGTRVGANAVLVKSVAPGSVVVGVPGQVLVPEGDAASDPLAFAVKSLLRRVERLEAAEAQPAEATGTEGATSGGSPASPAGGPIPTTGGASAPRPLYNDDGVWDLGDYAI